MDYKEAYEKIKSIATTYSDGSVSERMVEVKKVIAEYEKANNPINKSIEFSTDSGRFTYNILLSDDFKPNKNEWHSLYDDVYAKDYNKGFHADNAEWILKEFPKQLLGIKPPEDADVARVLPYADEILALIAEVKRYLDEIK